MNALHNSPLGSNLSFLRSKYDINFQSHNLGHCIKVATTVEQLDSQSKCLIVVVIVTCIFCTLWHNNFQLLC